MRSPYRSLFSLVVSAVASAALAQVQYSLTEMPPLPGCVDSGAKAINDLGDVAGWSRSATDLSDMATVWHAGVPTALGKARGGHDSYATAINNSGIIAGEGDDGDYRPNVLIFRGGTATFIDSGANNSHALKVTTSGQVIGTYVKGFGGASAWNVAVWSPDKDKYRRAFLPQYVDPAGLPTSVYGQGANNLGMVVGQVSGSNQWSARGGFWNNDSKHTLSLLDPLPGQWDAYANAINDNGLIVGISDVGSFSMTPVIWSPVTHAVTALPLMPGEINGTAIDVNNSGQVIGTHEGAPAIWIDGNLIDLQSALDASGAGWDLSVIYHINNKGQIVGSGFHNGQFRAYVLTPVSRP